MYLSYFIKYNKHNNKQYEETIKCAHSICGNIPCESNLIAYHVFTKFDNICVIYTINTLLQYRLHKDNSFFFVVNVNN